MGHPFSLDSLLALLFGHYYSHYCCLLYFAVCYMIIIFYPRQSLFTAHTHTTHNNLPSWNSERPEWRTFRMAGKFLISHGHLWQGRRQQHSSPASPINIYRTSSGKVSFMHLLGGKSPQTSEMPLHNFRSLHNGILTPDLCD